MLKLEDGQGHTFRFKDFRAATRDPRVLKALMGAPNRDKAFDDGFVIESTEHECQKLLTEAETGERPKAFAGVKYEKVANVGA